MKITASTLILVFFACSSCSFSQSFIFTPLKDDETQYKSLLSAVTEEYNKDIASVSGDNKKYITELYKARYDAIKEKFEDKEIITSAQANNYIQLLYSEILKYNPVLQNLQTRVIFVRDFWPNAASMGEGTI